MKHWTVLVSSVFGVGFLPKGSGTGGSLVTLPLAWWLLGLGEPMIYIAVVIGILLFGIWIPSPLLKLLNEATRIIGYSL